MTNPNSDAGSTQDAASAETCRLKESLIKSALAELDWPGLKAHMEAVGLDPGNITVLLGHIRRTSSLIMPYPDSKREARRATFFSSLAEYVRSSLGEEAVDTVTAEASLIEQVEEGYRGILNMLMSCEISRFLPEIRASACISRAAQQFWLLRRDVTAILKARKEIAFPSGPLMTTEDALPMSPDAIVTTLVDTATITLLMEGHKNKWFNADGHLVLPPLAKTGEDEQFKAGSTEVLAIYWLAWRRAEERFRFWGGSLDTCSMPDLPKWAPKGIQQVTTYRPDGRHVFDFIANERLNDRLGITLLQMINETNVSTKATGISKSAPLLPEAFVTIH